MTVKYNAFPGLTFVAIELRLRSNDGRTPISAATDAWRAATSADNSDSSDTVASIRSPNFVDEGELDFLLNFVLRRYVLGSRLLY